MICFTFYFCLGLSTKQQYCAIFLYYCRVFALPLATVVVSWCYILYDKIELNFLNILLKYQVQRLLKTR